MDQEYSTLEVAPKQHPDPIHRQQQSSSDDAPKYVVGDNEHEKYSASEGDGSDGLHAAPMMYDHEDIPTQGPPRNSGKRKWIILGGVVLLVVIIAAVVGGVVGSKHHSSSSKSTSTAPPNSSSTNSSSTTSTSSPSATSSAVVYNNNIASISYSSASVNYTRLYFQDDAGQIMEASVPADNSTWSVTSIGVSAKNGSALAAAVSRPDYTPVITVIYLDDDNLLNNYVYDTSMGSWAAGTLSSHQLTAMWNSSLTIMYDECTLCSNSTLLAFQDANGYVQVGDDANGWTLNQLSSDADLLMGTGLAMQPFRRADVEDQINLYVQRSNGSLALADRVPAALSSTGADMWAVNQQLYGEIALGSPIAAASSYSNASTGYDSWVQVFYLSDTGIEVNTWTGSINGWLQKGAHPSAMSNSTSNSMIYESISVTSDGVAFSLVSDNGRGRIIEQWQLADDYVDWTLVGSYDLTD